MVDNGIPGGLTTYAVSLSPPSATPISTLPLSVSLGLAYDGGGTLYQTAFLPTPQLQTATAAPIGSSSHLAGPSILFIGGQTAYVSDVFNRNVVAFTMSPTAITFQQTYPGNGGPIPSLATDARGDLFYCANTPDAIFAAGSGGTQTITIGQPATVSRGGTLTMKRFLGQRTGSWAAIATLAIATAGCGGTAAPPPPRAPDTDAERVCIAIAHTRCVAVTDECAESNAYTRGTSGRGAGDVVVSGRRDCRARRERYGGRL